MAKPRKPRARRQGSAGPKEAIILIPVTFNDGSVIPTEVLQSVFDELFVAFHGWTSRGTVKGAYRMQSGQKRVEDLLEVSVILDESQVPELEVMIAEWCRRLDQEVMLLKVTDSVVKFIPPRPQQ